MKAKLLTLLTIGLCASAGSVHAQAPYDQCPPGYMMQQIVQPNGYATSSCLPMQQQPYMPQPYYGYGVALPPPVYINPVYPRYYGGYGYGYGRGRGYEGHRR